MPEKNILSTAKEVPIIKEDMVAAAKSQTAAGMTVIPLEPDEDDPVEIPEPDDDEALEGK